MSFPLSAEMKSHAQHVVKNPHEKVKTKEELSKKLHLLKHARSFLTSLSEAYSENDWLFENIDEHDFEVLGLDKKDAKKYQKFLKNTYKMIKKAVETHNEDFSEVESLFTQNKKSLDAMQSE